MERPKGLTVRVTARPRLWPGGVKRRIIDYSRNLRETLYLLGGHYGRDIDNIRSA